MGFFTLVYYAIFFMTVMFLILNHAPNLLDIEPQAYTPKLMKFEGPLAVNKGLDKGLVILQGQVDAPESLVYNNGEIYASVADGRIVAIKDDKVHRTVADTSEGSKVPGRPLGMRFYEGDLYVADGIRGLLKVDIKTGKVTVLVQSSGIHSKGVNLANDLDIVDGVVYFSDVSTKWTASQIYLGMLEYENTGRLHKYDIATGKSEVLLEGLYYGNGVQVTHDKKALLVAEFTKDRILKYHLSGPQKGVTEIFAELPGRPDNIRPSSGGGYWVPVAFSRDATSRHLSDWLASYPKIRKALARLSHVMGTGLDWANKYISNQLIATIAEELRSGKHFSLLMNINHPLVVELGPDGKVVRSLHSTSPVYAMLSQGLEIDGNLYLGSFSQSHMVKLKL